jgi:hypothetical protein
MCRPQPNTFELMNSFGGKITADEASLQASWAYEMKRHTAP